MSIRSRISIPGGTCEFDLPAYYAWQQLPRRAPPRRPAALGRHADAAGRSAAGAARPAARLGRAAQGDGAGGQYPAEPAAGRVFQLLRLRLDPAPRLVPEISGHRLMVSVRLMRQEADGRLQPSHRRHHLRAHALRLRSRGAEATTGSPEPIAPRIVRCPACGGDSVYAPRNPFRPFCSERCRGADLGAWASGRLSRADAADVARRRRQRAPARLKRRHAAAPLSPRATSAARPGRGPSRRLPPELLPRSRRFAARIGAAAVVAEARQQIVQARVVGAAVGARAAAVVAR